MTWVESDPDPCSHFMSSKPLGKQHKVLKSSFLSPTPTLMAFTGVTNAHGPSPQPAACILRPQQEVTRPKARFNPTLPKKWGEWGTIQVPTYLDQSLHLHSQW